MSTTPSPQSALPPVVPALVLPAVPAVVSVVEPVPPVVPVLESVVAVPSVVPDPVVAVPSVVPDPVVAVPSVPLDPVVAVPSVVPDPVVAVPSVVLDAVVAVPCVPLPVAVSVPTVASVALPIVVAVPCVPDEAVAVPEPLAVPPVDAVPPVVPGSTHTLSMHTSPPKHWPLLEHGQPASPTTHAEVSVALAPEVAVAVVPSSPQAASEAGAAASARVIQRRVRIMRTRLTRPARAAASGQEHRATLAPRATRCAGPALLQNATRTVRSPTPAATRSQDLQNGSCGSCPVLERS
jgi:hypothetical protein